MKTFGSVSIGIAGNIVAMLETPSDRTAPPVECRHQGNIERSHLALALAVLAGRGLAHATITAPCPAGLRAATSASAFRRMKACPNRAPAPTARRRAGCRGDSSKPVRVSRRPSARLPSAVLRLRQAPEQRGGLGRHLLGAFGMS